MDNFVDDNTPQYSNIRFRFYVRSGSSDSNLLNYLKSFGREANSMVLESIRAYWLAVASKDSAFVAGEALQKLAVQTVSALVARARYLCVTFDLDPAAFGLSAPGTLTFCPAQLQPQLSAPAAQQEPVVSAAPLSVAVEQQPERSLLPESGEPDGFNDDDEEIEAFDFYAASADLQFNLAGL